MRLDNFAEFYLTLPFGTPSLTQLYVFAHPYAPPLVYLPLCGSLHWRSSSFYLFRLWLTRSLSLSLSIWNLSLSVWNFIWYFISLPLSLCVFFFLASHNENAFAQVFAALAVRKNWLKIGNKMLIFAHVICGALTLKYALNCPNFISFWVFLFHSVFQYFWISLCGTQVEPRCK